MVPAATGTSPSRARISVVLPAPFGPSMPMNSDRIPASRGPAPGGDAHNWDGPRRYRPQPEQGADQCRLAGAVGPQHADELAVRDGQRHIGQDVPAAEREG